MKNILILYKQVWNRNKEENQIGESFLERGKEDTISQYSVSTDLCEWFEVSEIITNVCISCTERGVVNKRNFLEFPVMWLSGTYNISCDSFLSVLSNCLHSGIYNFHIQHSGWQDENLNLNLHVIEARWRKTQNEFIIDKLRCVRIYCLEHKSNVESWNSKEFC